MITNSIHKTIGICLTIFASCILSSCAESDNDDIKLSGDISQLIPSYAWQLNCHVVNAYSTTYLKAFPNINADFDFWGLHVAKVNYYIDNDFISYVTNAPFVLNYQTMELIDGKHTMRAVMTISGDDCNDVIMEKTQEFSVLNQTYRPHGEFFIDYNDVTTGDILAVTLELLANRSTDGCEIKQISYIWDDNIMEIQSSAPFSWNYRITEQPNTQHKLQINISYKDNESDNLNYSFSNSTFKIHTDSDAIHSYRLKSTSNVYKKDETLIGVARLYRGRAVSDTYEVRILFDGKQIAQSSDFPYINEYKLSNESIGIHQLQIIWQNGNTASMDYEYIAITE